jgi:hypothetical protein
MSLDNQLVRLLANLPSNLGLQAQRAWEEMKRVLNSTAERTPLRGSGDPNGVVTASVGTLYLRSDGGVGTTFYVKEVGEDHFGWAAK